MKMYSTSTKASPLLFFETFLKKNSVLKYKDQFYNNPINPSFVSNENEGFIEYTKDLYEYFEEVVPVKIYFKDRLRELIQTQYNTSKVLSSYRVIEIKNTEINAKIYINRQIQKLSILRNVLNYDLNEKDILIEALDELEKYYRRLLDSTLIDESKTISIYKIPGRTFFDLKKEMKPRHIKKLYEVTSNLDIIDYDLVSEDDFLNVFIQSKLPNQNYKIAFNKNNRIVVCYFNAIKGFFNNFTPRTIDRSMSFYNKGGKVLNENDINRVNNYLNKNDLSKYHYIQAEIDSILL